MLQKWITINDYRPDTSLVNVTLFMKCNMLWTATNDYWPDTSWVNVTLFMHARISFQKYFLVLISDHLLDWHIGLLLNPYQCTLFPRVNVNV